MAVKYLRFDGKRVSRRHYHVLAAARADGVIFRLNSGHRTFTEQMRLWLSQPPLAAYPTHRAPHIRTGRADHALDVDTYFGEGVRALEDWIEKQLGGIEVNYTVPGEGWHVEIPADDLERLADALKGPRVLHRGDKGQDVERMKVLLRGSGFLKARNVGAKFTYKARRSLMRFQRSKGIKADGIYGPTSRRLLERAYDRKRRR